MPPSHVIAARAPRGERRPLPITTDPDLLASVAEDAAHYPDGIASGLLYPENEADVAAALQRGTPVLPIGAQSSLTGGATPRGELVVSLARLDAYTVTGDTVAVGAGVTLDTLQSTLARQRKLYPPAPTYLGACAGGVVATNAAGPATFKYGATRTWVEALTVVLPSGDVVDAQRGQYRAHPDGYFELLATTGQATRIPIVHLSHPSVPKCSAGYALAHEMDLVDLFIGSEGTLGVITSVTFRLLSDPPAQLLVVLALPSEQEAIALTGALREASHRTWSEHDPRGVDVSAIEYADRRCVALLAEDAADNPNISLLRGGCEALLFVTLDLPSGTTSDQVWSMISDALEPSAPDNAVTRFCTLLDSRGLLDCAEFALPEDAARRAGLLALREAIPEGVNRRVALARQQFSAAISKMAGDFVVPFDAFTPMLEACHAACDARELDLAVWGHISDGNIHPNIVPRCADDGVRGKDALLEAGRHVIALGGSPLAEHGVGRHPVKQEFLRMLRGDHGVAAMRAVKRAFDPRTVLAPGVLLALDTLAAR